MSDTKLTVTAQCTYVEHGTGQASKATFRLGTGLETVKFSLYSPEIAGLVADGRPYVITIAEAEPDVPPE